MGRELGTDRGGEVSGKPVRVKLQTQNTFGGARASEPLEDDEDDAPAARPARKTTRR